ncbi:three prime histone mRNA exonuclease [Capsaspora owczarzaki ATCC 30864]|uniref:Three prime histone mRNA exonuclease n=1 Tax=Capsaspora owczarzaki (strain ATCC 30864) TaxID=595528 RepID=A0A0D2X030_CAPO3|nr:three prime histone mRNA exonuclease [Capsaspora owczarzaki ATCC 30864]KJE88344.1 three prime histone mRNA exonuclease [Capsaspora owczarzaki ATCC 30864]|eukprot:XP_004364879.1 three prime histone mRNA exonuclease [Capsaspora owczarzaki ATCC 30864]
MSANHEADPSVPTTAAAPPTEFGAGSLLGPGPASPQRTRATGAAAHSDPIPVSPSARRPSRGSGTGTGTGTGAGAGQGGSPTIASSPSGRPHRPGLDASAHGSSSSHHGLPSTSPSRGSGFGSGSPGSMMRSGNANAITAQSQALMSTSPSHHHQGFQHGLHAWMSSTSGSPSSAGSGGLSRNGTATRLKFASPHKLDQHKLQMDASRVQLLLTPNAIRELKAARSRELESGELSQQTPTKSARPAARSGKQQQRSGKAKSPAGRLVGDDSEDDDDDDEFERGDDMDAFDQLLAEFQKLDNENAFVEQAQPIVNRNSSKHARQTAPSRETILAQLMSNSLDKCFVKADMIAIRAALTLRGLPTEGHPKVLRQRIKSALVFERRQELLSRLSNLSKSESPSSTSSSSTSAASSSSSTNPSTPDAEWDTSSTSPLVEVPKSSFFANPSEMSDSSDTDGAEASEDDTAESDNDSGRPARRTRRASRRPQHRLLFPGLEAHHQNRPLMALFTSNAEKMKQTELADLEHSAWLIDLAVSRQAGHSLTNCPVALIDHPQSDVAAITRAFRIPSHYQPQFDYFVVIDYEATCEENASFSTYPHEIIEFPAVVVNARTGEIVHSWRSYVRPVLNPTLTPFCTQLTGITQSQVDASPVFEDVFEQFVVFLRDTLGVDVRDPTTPISPDKSEPAPINRSNHPPRERTISTSSVDSTNSVDSVSSTSSAGSAIDSDTEEPTTPSFTIFEEIITLPAIQPITSSVLCAESSNTNYDDDDDDEEESTSEIPGLFGTDTRLRSFGRRRFAILCDGPWDLRDFMTKQCRHSQIFRPWFTQQWVNLRMHFSKFYHMKLGGIDFMLESLGMQFQGNKHSGLDDATNIARVACQMLRDGCALHTNDDLIRQQHGV